MMGKLLCKIFGHNMEMVACSWSAEYGGWKRDQCKRCNHTEEKDLAPARIDWNKEFDFLKFRCEGNKVRVHRLNVDILPERYRKVDDMYEIEICTETKPEVGDIVCGYLYGNQEVFVYEKKSEPHIGQTHGGYNWINYKVK